MNQITLISIALQLLIRWNIQTMDKIDIVIDLLKSNKGAIMKKKITKKTKKVSKKSIKKVSKKSK
jgi:hypothetical protein